MRGCVEAGYLFELDVEGFVAKEPDCLEGSEYEIIFLLF